MARHTYTVLFTSSACGPQGEPFSTRIPRLMQLAGAAGNLPPRALPGGERFQVRGLQVFGSDAVLMGYLGHRRDEHPAVIDANDREQQLELEEGSELVEKASFVYHSDTNVLVWQVCRAAGGISRLEEYLGSVLGEMVTFHHHVDQDRLEEVMAGDLYEFKLQFARPSNYARDQQGDPVWEDSAFKMMSDAHAANAVFQFRANSGGALGLEAKEAIRRLLGQPGTKKIMTRITGETKLSEITAPPLRDTISVELIGGYPDPVEVQRELEAAYDRNRNHFQ